MLYPTFLPVLINRCKITQFCLLFANKILKNTQYIMKNAEKMRVRMLFRLIWRRIAFSSSFRAKQDRHFIALCYKCTMPCVTNVPSLVFRLYHKACCKCTTSRRSLCNTPPCCIPSFRSGSNAWLATKKALVAISALRL